MSVRHRGILESLQRGMGSALGTPALRSYDVRAVDWVEWGGGFSPDVTSENSNSLSELP